MNADIVLRGDPRLLHGLPPSMKRDLSIVPLLMGSKIAAGFRRFPKDRDFDTLALAWGAPHMPREWTAAFALGLQQLPMKTLQQTPPGWPGSIDPWQGGGYGSPPQAGPSLRYTPFALWDSTALTANQTTYASIANYINPTGYPFVVTHVTFSMDRDPIAQFPQFRCAIQPAGQKAWMGENVSIDVQAICTHLSNSVANTTGSMLAHWRLPGGAQRYIVGPSENFFASASNDSAEGSIECALGIILTKLDSLRSPRVLWARQSLAASAGETPFDTSTLRNDGDFAAECHQVTISSGATGRWGFGPTSPNIFIRSDRGGAGSDWTARLTQAICLNNVPGRGAYWQLPVPQRIPAAQTISIRLVEQLGAAHRANIGFLGYLEVPVG